jgi:hypothetical protein
MNNVCHMIHHLFNGLPSYHFPFDAKKLPKNGIYVVFEKGESAHRTNRIVRIGTHTGDHQLLSRLLQHFVKENKDRSIFRKNIGRALLKKGHNPYLQVWDLDLTTKKAKEQYSNMIDFENQNLIERQVTTYMQNNLFFAVFQVDSKEDRLKWESRLISTVSLCPECRPSSDWLGLSSPKGKIRESGLWLVNELYKEPLTEEEYYALKRQVQFFSGENWL